MQEKPQFSDKLIYIKNEEQIEGIRKSSQLTKKLLDMVEDRIAEGVTTNAVSYTHLTLPTILLV